MTTLTSCRWHDPHVGPDVAPRDDHPMNPETLAEGFVDVHAADGVVTVTLNRPEARNAQTPAMWAALVEVHHSLPADTRAVVLRGEGPTFSAGLDRRMFTPDGIPGQASLSALSSLPDAELMDAILVFQDAFTWWRACDAITVAAVQGHAVGAGFQLALGCDLIVADPSARFAMKETSLGLVPDLGGTAPLVEAIGYSRALEMCVSGREVTAEEALRIGLVNRVAGDEGLEVAVADMLAPILAAPAAAVTATKHLLRGAQHRHPHDQREAERAAQVGRLRDLTRLLGGQ